jgi:P4 family phage/plasmid primase-like protien
MNPNANPIYELRALRGEEVLVGHYDDKETFQAHALQLNEQRYNIYSPINELIPEKFSNLNTPPAPGGAAGNASIARRLWLPEDIDPSRPRGTTATDEQKACAREMADRIMEFWMERGVTPRIVDSGNGYQVLVPINLPNDADSEALVKRVLEAHRQTFATPGAKLDSLYDAPRIMRVPGFKNWKGDGPHRVATLLGEASGLATKEMLEAIAPPPPEAAGIIVKAHANYTGVETSKGVVERVLALVDESPNWRTARKPHLWMADLSEDLCPNADQHSQGNTKGTFVVTISDSGFIGAKCNHAGCSDVTWKHVRSGIEARAKKNSLESASDRLQGPDGLNLTALGNMERMLAKHGPDIRHAQGRSMNSPGVFYSWNGSRWEGDSNSKVYGLAQALTRSLGGLVIEATRLGWSADAVKAVARFWSTSESDHMAREMVTLLRPHVAVDRGQFDADPMLLGVRNGVIDLRDGTHRAAKREDLITKQANVIYSMEAVCETWIEFLSQTTNGRLDLQRYLAQCAGICLSGLTEEHHLFIVQGPGGTGKTTFQEVLKFVWGDYSCGIDPNSLAASGKPEAARARPDLAKLPGMRLVFANESRAGMRFDEGLVKALTGGDTMTARNLFEAEFDFVPTHKIWLRTNDKPIFDGGDSGMQRRIKLVPFDHIVVNKDPKMPEKLRAEASGILNWALAGLRDYQQNGLVEPEIVTTGTKEYVEGLDQIKQFILAKCEVGASYDQPAGELYQVYKIWCEGEQLRWFGIKRFASELDGRGFKKGETKTGNVWRGLRLRPPSVQVGW